MIFFKLMIILRKYTVLQKTGKMPDILWLSSEFLDGTAFEKLSPPTGNKNLPQTLRNCPVLHENWQIFQKWGVLLTKSKKFPENWEFLQGGRLLPLRFFSKSFLNFRRESRPETNLDSSYSIFVVYPPWSLLPPDHLRALLSSLYEQSMYMFSPIQNVNSFDSCIFSLDMLVHVPLNIT